MMNLRNAIMNLNAAIKNEDNCEFINENKDVIVDFFMSKVLEQYTEIEKTIEDDILIAKKNVGDNEYAVSYDVGYLDALNDIKELVKG